MYHVNRSVMIVKAKQPFVDWINSTNAPGDSTVTTIDDVNEEPSAYLIPEYEDDRELKRILPGIIDCIWEAELMGWYVDETLWPKDQSIKQFNEWFDFEISSMVMDIMDVPLEKEEA